MMGELVFEKKYEPDYSEYRGTAYYGRIDLVTLRTGLPPLDDFTSWMAEKAVEFNVSSQGGRMLLLKIFRDPGMWGPIPTYDWRIEVWFYFPPESGIRAEAVPAVVWTILKLILAAVIVWGIYAAIRQASEIFWVPPEERPELFKIIAWSVFLAALGIGLTPIIVELLRRV